MPNLPQRATGRLRYEKLLDATDQLLSKREANDISLYDIAEHAKVPTASVYHFLPSVTAAFVGLAQRYQERILIMLDKPLNHARLNSWQDVVVIKANAGRQFYETHAVARKLFLGTLHIWQVRQQESRANSLAAKIVARDYKRHFMIHDVEFLAEKIEIGIGLIDTTWSLSYLLHGCVTDYYVAEANRAYVGYMRNYISEHVEKRAKPLPQ